MRYVGGKVKGWNDKRVAKAADKAQSQDTLAEGEARAKDKAPGAEHAAGKDAPQRLAPPKAAGQAGPAPEPGQSKQVTVEIAGAGAEGKAAAPGAGRQKGAPAGDAAAGRTAAPKSPPPAEAQKIAELAKDAENIKPVSDENLVKDYDVEITVQMPGETHTYRRRRSDNS